MKISEDMNNAALDAMGSGAWRTYVNAPTKRLIMREALEAALSTRELRWFDYPIVTIGALFVVAVFLGIGSLFNFSHFHGDYAALIFLATRGAWSWSKRFYQQ